MDHIPLASLPKAHSWRSKSCSSCTIGTNDCMEREIYRESPLFGTTRRANDEHEDRHFNGMFLKHQNFLFVVVSKNSHLVLKSAAEKKALPACGACHGCMWRAGGLMSAFDWLGSLLPLPALWLFPHGSAYHGNTRLSIHSPRHNVKRNDNDGLPWLVQLVLLGWGYGT